MLDRTFTVVCPEHWDQDDLRAFAAALSLMLAGWQTPKAPPGPRLRLVEPA